MKMVKNRMGIEELLRRPDDSIEFCSPEYLEHVVPRIIQIYEDDIRIIKGVMRYIKGLEGIENG